MRRIVCAGMVRSGSTVLFNIVRLLFELKEGPKNVHSCWIKEYRRANNRKIHVVKIHSYNRSLIDDNSTVLTSSRDMRDVAASLHRKGWLIRKNLPIKKAISQIISKHNQWSAHSVYNMVYEEMVKDRKKVIRDIAKALGLNVSEQDVLKVDKRLNSLKYTSDGRRNGVYNLINLLHKGHVTDGGVGTYAKTLKPKIIKEIEKNFPEWLIDKEEV